MHAMHTGLPARTRSRTLPCRGRGVVAHPPNRVVSRWRPPPLHCNHPLTHCNLTRMADCICIPPGFHIRIPYPYRGGRHYRSTRLGSRLKMLPRGVAQKRTRCLPRSCLAPSLQCISKHSWHVVASMRSLVGDTIINQNSYYIPHRTLGLSTSTMLLFLLQGVF